jgi:hypothetical protein
MKTADVMSRAHDLMPSLLQCLEELVSLPSVAFAGYPSERRERMGRTTLEMFRRAGFRNARLMEVPTGHPPIYAEVPGPPGAPVVMLHAHYDVQPAPPEQGWSKTLVEAHPELFEAGGVSASRPERRGPVPRSPSSAPSSTSLPPQISCCGAPRTSRGSRIHCSDEDSIHGRSGDGR